MKNRFSPFFLIKTNTIHSLLLVIIIALGAGCNHAPNNSTTSGKDTETDNSTATATNEGEAASTDTEGKPKHELRSADYYDAITIGNGVRLREQATSNSPKVGELATGTMLKVMEETKREVVFKRTVCDQRGYKWYKVITATGLEGWMYGKYVYHKEPRTAAITGEYVGARYTFDGIDYTFGVAKDNSFETHNSYGYTGCADGWIPFFHQEGSAVVYPIFVKDTDIKFTQLETNANRYWEFVKSDQREEKLLRILPILNGVRITHAINEFDSKGEATVEISMKKFSDANRFYAELKSFEKVVD